MLTVFVLVVHVIVCVALILIILLQTGKGADIGAAFGGGSSQTVFGSGGGATFLSKITIGAAVIFMVTSIVLSYFADRGLALRDKSIMSGEPKVKIEQTIPTESSSAPVSSQDTSSVPTPAQPAPEGAK
ncbi:MAG: preprotein translocase subunit SecG [Syntrophaceae bacterium]|nr:preprotein translocase subunit SecG [Syntrophaceae bacterium]